MANAVYFYKVHETITTHRLIQHAICLIAFPIALFSVLFSSYFLSINTNLTNVVTCSMADGTIEFCDGKLPPRQNGQKFSALSTLNRFDSARRNVMLLLHTSG